MQSREIVGIFLVLTFLASSSISVYSAEVPVVDLAPLIKEKGHPGIVPSPELLRLYSSLGLSLPQVADWAAPLPERAVTGTRNILVIRIDFTDKAGTQSQAYYQNLIFGTSQGQMKHYYSEVSYGLLTVSGTVTTTWLRVTSHAMTWWGSDSAGIDNANAFDGIDIFDLAREAVVLADSVFNFAPYDTNNDGTITADELSLCIVHAGNGQESSGVSTDIWSHRWYIFGKGYINEGYLLSDTFVDGKRISNHPGDLVGGYYMQAETSPMGTFAHEFGHDLGLPDLYDIDYTSDGIGQWGLMGYGSWLGSPPGSSPAHSIGWCKAKLGWNTPTVVSSGSNVPVKQIETYQSQSLYRLTITSTEYFFIENRQKTGYDSYLPGAGILIWHVDDSKTSNRYDADRWVDLEEAHGVTQHLDSYTDGNNGDVNDPFYSPKKTSFTDGTDPNSKTKAGASSGIGVTSISASGTTMTANFAGGHIPAGSEADLAGRSAWPEHHHFVLSKDGDPNINDKDGTPGLQTLYGKVENTGTQILQTGTYKVVWKIVDSQGTSVGTYKTVGTAWVLGPGDQTTLTYDLDVSTFDGKYYVTAQCWYYDLAGDKIKEFSFSVVP